MTMRVHGLCLMQIFEQDFGLSSCASQPQEGLSCGKKMGVCGKNFKSRTVSSSYRQYGR